MKPDVKWSLYKWVSGLFLHCMMKRILTIGLISGIIMILFQIISLCVQYRYLRIEYYVSLVAICFGLAGFLINQRNPRTRSPQQPDLLSSKERMVFDLILLGKSNKEIAAEQFIEISTVKTHINHIYSKLGVTSRKEVRQKYGK